MSAKKVIKTMGIIIGSCAAVGGAAYGVKTLVENRSKCSKN